MRTIPAGLQTLLNSGVTTLCFCWQVDRQDGTTLGFTNHDVDVPISGVVNQVDGSSIDVTFLKSTSFTGSAIESQLGLAVSTMDIMGVLDSASIMEADLLDGRYDGAALTVYLVDWTNVANRVVIPSGILGQVTIGDLAYQAELRSLSQHFQQYVGSLCQAKCRTFLGSTGSGLENGCNFTMPAPVSGTVAMVTSRTQFQVAAAGVYPDGTKGSLSLGYFASGVVTFTSGANKGLSMEILNSDPSLNITTERPLPEDITIYDTCTLQIGCDRTLDVCIQNYNNVNNFRGEPYVPGKDQVFRVHGEG